MSPKIWSEASLHPEAQARLEPEAEIVPGKSVETLPGSVAAVIGGAVIDADFLDAAGPDLKLVIRHGIGYDRVDVDAASARGILVANTPDGPTESTAEQAVALLLAVAKRVVQSDSALRADTYHDRSRLRGTEVFDHVLGVVGYGRIGRRVTEICALGLKMHVLVYDPFVSEASLPDGVETAASLEELLVRADFLTLHTPYIEATHHLIGADELALMKPGSYLINVSRGPVIDERALIEALQSGHLAGAGLDVFDPEPPERDNPLLAMDNVVLTPHVASNTPQGSYRMSMGVADQVLQVLRGERPTNLVNADVWPGRMA